MRPGQNNKRMRGRPNSNRKGPNPLTRSYESSGPDVKIRGTAHHIGEKYLQLARDAQSSGDPVTAESYLQHAEHYFRLIAMAQQAQQQSASGYQRQPGDANADEIDDGDDFTGIPDRFASPPERFASPPQPAFTPPGLGAPQPNPDRSFYGNPDKQAFERPERALRQEPRQDARQERPFQDKTYPEKSYPDRPYLERNGAERGGQENRSQRPGRGPRDFRNDGAPRGEQRGESRAPVEEIERKGLPAFITAPVRVQAEPLGAESSVETLATVLVDQPETEHEVNGFHLRPRRRRRSKAEMAIDQAAANEDAGAADRVGD